MKSSFSLSPRVPNAESENTSNSLNLDDTLHENISETTLEHDSYNYNQGDVAAGLHGKTVSVTPDEISTLSELPNVSLTYSPTIPEVERHSVAHSDDILGVKVRRKYSDVPSLPTNGSTVDRETNTHPSKTSKLNVTKEQHIVPHHQAREIKVTGSEKNVIKNESNNNIKKRPYVIDWRKLRYNRNKKIPQSKKYKHENSLSLTRSKYYNRKLNLLNMNLNKSLKLQITHDWRNDVRFVNINSGESNIPSKSETEKINSSNMLHKRIFSTTPKVNKVRVGNLSAVQTSKNNFDGPPPSNTFLASSRFTFGNLEELEKKTIDAFIKIPLCSEIKILNRRRYTPRSKLAKIYSKSRNKRLRIYKMVRKLMKVQFKSRHYWDETTNAFARKFDRYFYKKLWRVLNYQFVRRKKKWKHNLKNRQNKILNYQKRKIRKLNLLRRIKNFNLSKMFKLCSLKIKTPQRISEHRNLKVPLSSPVVCIAAGRVNKHYKLFWL